MTYAVVSVKQLQIFNACESQPGIGDIGGGREALASSTSRGNRLKCGPVQRGTEQPALSRLLLSITHIISFFHMRSDTVRGTL